MTGPIGYVYQADIYCPDHIVGQIDGQADVDTHEVESKLDYLATMFGVDRYDESSYDSGDFPKIYVGTPHDGCSVDNGYEPGQCGDRCATCGEPLDGECPNTAVPDEYITTMVDNYIEAALWATSDTRPEDPEDTTPRPLDDDFDASDLTPEARDSIESDCEQFATDNWADLKDMDPAQAGHDFLLTRDGHGAGFWDRGLGDKGDRLTAACKPYGDSGLYVGDSGDIHTTNESARCTDCGCETLA